jgi:hypothetical protein
VLVTVQKTSGKIKKIRELTDWILSSFSKNRQGQNNSHAKN